MALAVEAPEVDFDSYDEYVTLENVFYSEVQRLVRSRINAGLHFWRRWPYLVSLNMGDACAPCTLRITKGQGGVWCVTVVAEIEEILQEVISSLLSLSRMRGQELTEQELHTIASDSLAHAIAPRVRALLIKNIVAVSCTIPFVPYAFSGGVVLYSWPQIFASRLAIMMGGHARVGCDSPLAALDEGLLRLIAMQTYSPEWPYYDP